MVQGLYLAVLLPSHHFDGVVRWCPLSLLIIRNFSLVVSCLPEELMSWVQIRIDLGRWEVKSLIQISSLFQENLPVQVDILDPVLL